MNNSLKMWVLLLIMVMISACSKTPGKTSAKLNIISGNFSALLTSKANNGLIFYGTSTDGKFFSKKIDTDTVDLVFPNGTWNFYAVSWNLTTTPPAVPDFTGSTYCGKASATFNGTDATINMNLTNAGCNDPAFSANVGTSSIGEYLLPSVAFFTCKDVSGMTTFSSTACDQNAGANYNKGYATSYRVVAYESNNFGGAISSGPVAASACMRADFSTLSGALNNMSPTIDLGLANNIRIPTTAGNGLALAVEVYYSSGAAPGATPVGCDPSLGFDVVALDNGPRTKLFINGAMSTFPASYNLFVQSNQNDVCQGPRLGSTNFAAGFGTTGSPYAICTQAQLDIFRNNFATYKTSSFDLLTDINYGFANIAPIGDALVAAGGNTVTNFYGSAASLPVFDGRNHKISNFKMDCIVPSGTAPNNTVGFFRSVQDATIKNLTINNGVIMCDGGSEVGVLAGKFNDTTGSSSIQNVKVHGHSEGINYVAGLVGNVTGTSVSVLNTHVAGEFGGQAYSGGLFGQYSITGASTISQVSFSGNIHTHNNGGTTTSSWSGGIAGYMATGAGPINLSKAVVLADTIEGSTVVGGIAGETLNVNIQDSYVKGNLRASGMTAPPSTYAMIGGAVGKATNGALTRVISTETVKSSSRGTNDFSSGGLVGGTAGTAPTCGSSYYSGDNDPSNPIACGTQSATAQINSRISYTSSGFSISANVGNWDAAASPSPTFTCSPSDSGSYYEASTANPSTIYGAVLPGDIILCNGSAFSKVTLLNRPTTLATYTWTMPDDGYDIPRLTFESDVEASATYLQRSCHGHFATQYGSGTAADPKWICTLSQFQAMAADPASSYILKKNIFYDGTAGAFSPLPAAAYTLNGNNFGLYNFSMTLPSMISSNLNFGIFSKLLPTSTVSNLRVVKSNISYSGMGVTTSGFPQVNVGVLVGANSGVLNRINIEDSEARLAATFVAGDTIHFGGAVGFNAGFIKNSEISSRVTLEDGSSPAGSLVHAAGGIAFNSGTISGVRSHSSASRNFNCTSTHPGPFNFSPQELMASFVGHNEGSISEVDLDGGEMRSSIFNVAGGTSCVMGNVAAAFSSFVAENTATGAIADFNIQAKMNLAGFYQPPQLFYINNASTTVARGFVTFDTSDANFILPQFNSPLGNWNPSTNPMPAVGTGPQSTCTFAEAGNYWTSTSSVSGLSTSIGTTTYISANDIVMCNGAQNVIIPAAATSAILTPMTQVTYIVRYPITTPPALVPGRYYDNDLHFAVGSAGGLRVDTIATPSLLFDDSSWSIATDFFSLGTSKWLLDLRNGMTYTTKVPRPSKTEGGLDDLGAPFN